MTDHIADRLGLSTGIAELNAALAAAQGEFPPIKKEKTAKAGSYSYTYASLDAILAACRPVLSKHGLAVTQLLEENEHGAAVRTELRHASGAVLGSSFPLPPGSKTPQELGSLLTYIRRYALTALLGVAAEDDDDAQGAGAGGKPKRGRRAGPAPEPEPRPRAELLELLKERLGVDPVDRPPPAPFEDWIEWTVSTCRDRWEKTSSDELTDDELAELIGLLDDAQIPF